MAIVRQIKITIANSINRFTTLAFKGNAEAKYVQIMYRYNLHKYGMNIL